MGAGVDNNSGVKSGRRRWKPAAEINVTPFVDVMLVLLIVFMISAPLLTVGIEVDLPDTEARAMTTSEEPLTITIQSDGTIFLMETPVPYDELGPRLRAIAGAQSGARVYIRADRGVPYGEVMRVMARVSASGHPNIGLVTDPVRD
ncbi:biopolymer transporter ExbD [Alkalicaulis satelles]|uniref:Biopolymer transporter ExbD n=1 Tax=Alkalicaulis satelles TaxID=2609175 RepID=A0A5M6ZF12_9PROT|nr:biopolymer transporter ExbD [Alkalicaulis satelles]KAA5802347.1 biopolymer transporter ExbD [Alkalicaulis satelles]